MVDVNKAITNLHARLEELALLFAMQGPSKVVLKKGELLIFSAKKVSKALRKASFERRDSVAPTQDQEL